MNKLCQPKMCIDSQSKSELLQRLAATDIDVPPLGTEGRTKEHVERWSVLRLLATLAQYERLTYPLRVCPDDRPDFVVSLPSHCIGIEVTEAVPTSLAWAYSRRVKQNCEKPVMLEKYKPGEARRTPESIEETARGLNSGSVWAGSAVEEQFADVMLHYSLDKKEKFRKIGFKSHASNWLIIYKNWPLPGLDEPLGAKHFSKRLSELHEPLPFERVFVECQKTFWEFSHGSVTSLQINDIWDDSEICILTKKTAATQAHRHPTQP